LHQSEEIIEDVIEAEEVPFDIDADDDAVLDAILTPCAAHDAETEREIEQENLTDIFPHDEIVQYTDPLGNTFETPVVEVKSLEPTPEDYSQFELEEAELWEEGTVSPTDNPEEKVSANLDVIEAEDADAFDLDFNEDLGSTDTAIDFDF
jgi:hypothetical protein